MKVTIPIERFVHEERELDIEGEVLAQAGADPDHIGKIEVSDPWKGDWTRQIDIAIHINHRSVDEVFRFCVIEERDSMGERVWCEDMDGDPGRVIIPDREGQAPLMLATLYRVADFIGAEVFGYEIDEGGFDDDE